jgi:hypothetical protein
VTAALMLATAACGYGAGATFNQDGSVSVSLKFLFPKSLMTAGAAGGSVTGLSPSDIQKANAELASKYPGAKIEVVTEGEESGAQVTIPFKTEKDAFAFMTQPSQLSPTGVTSGAGSSIDLAKTGGLFASATHTTSGTSDTYTFKTQPQPLPSPSPGSQDLVGADVVDSLFNVTFSLTVPQQITSAPDALFTLDRKTAVWKLSLTRAQTLTATTGPSVALAGFASNGGSGGQSPFLVIGVALVAIGLGFAFGMLSPWRRLGAPAVVPGGGPIAAAPVEFVPSNGAPPVGQPMSTTPPGPPPEWLPPQNPGGS